jgi:hypothetical protein
MWFLHCSHDTRICSHSKAGTKSEAKAAQLAHEFVRLFDQPATARKAAQSIHSTALLNQFRALPKLITVPTPRHSVKMTSPKVQRRTYRLLQACYDQWALIRECYRRVDENTLPNEPGVIVVKIPTIDHQAVLRTLCVTR